MRERSSKGRSRQEITPTTWSPLDHRQVPVAELVHAPDRLDHRGRALDRVGVGGHHLAEPGRARIEPGRDHPHQQVALGEDAPQPIAVADQDAAAAGLGHPLGGLMHGVVRPAD